MKSNSGIAVLLTIMLIFSTQVFSQISRRNQIELFAGAGFPMSPDYFKDYFKIGLSLNAQYVVFPSPRFGIPIFIGYERFTVDNNAINSDIKDGVTGLPLFYQGSLIGYVSDASFDIKGTSSDFKFGVGIRPYLTKPESSTQFFLFGNVTYNIFKEKEEINGGSITARDLSGTDYTLDLTEQDVVDILGQSNFEENFDKMGVGLGAGIEIPAGSSLNLIFQGMYNIIFSKDESKGIDKDHSFIQATAGIVF